MVGLAHIPIQPVNHLQRWVKLQIDICVFAIDGGTLTKNEFGFGELNDGEVAFKARYIHIDGLVVGGEFPGAIINNRVGLFGVEGANGAVIPKTAYSGHTALAWTDSAGLC